jgi:hypothetical protein
LRGDDWVGKWLLDLTETSLFSLFAYWGERFDCLEVIVINQSLSKASGR